VIGGAGRPGPPRAGLDFGSVEPYPGVDSPARHRRIRVKIQVLSKKTKGGLFVQFDITSPDEEENHQLACEPPGEMCAMLHRLEAELRKTGEICESPDTGFFERIEPISDSSFLIGGYFEVRDEPASEALIARLEKVFPDADVDVEYL
jgi:hypothetical protein